MSTNLKELIRVLEQEKQELEDALTTLHKLAAMREGKEPDGLLNPRSTRGRKSMGAEERKQVSERMRKYWASRNRTAIHDALKSGMDIQ